MSQSIPLLTASHKQQNSYLGLATEDPSNFFQGSDGNDHDQTLDGVDNEYVHTEYTHNLLVDGDEAGRFRRFSARMKRSAKTNINVILLAVVLILVS